MEPCRLIAIWIPINNPPKNVAVGLVSKSQTVFSPSVRLPHLGFVAGAPEGVGVDDAGNVYAGWTAKMALRGAVL